MKTLTLVSTTILISMSCAWAKETLVQPELFKNPRFQRYAPMLSEQKSDSHTSLRNIKSGRVAEQRAIHELALHDAQQTAASDMRTSVKRLPTGRVNETRSIFEPQTATPVAIRLAQKPIQEDHANDRSSWGSFFGFGSLRNVSVSGFFNPLVPEETDVILTPVPVASQPKVEEPAAPTTSWFGWISNKMTTSMSSLFADEKPSEPQTTSQKSVQVAVEEPEQDSSFLQRSFKWASETKNWVTDMVWGAPKQHEDELPLSLEDVEELETIHLPAAMAVVFKTGYENQEPGVLEALFEKEEQVRKRYFGTRKLSFDEALRKAELLQEENHEWGELAAYLPKQSRQRRMTH